MVGERALRLMPRGPSGRCEGKECLELAQQPVRIARSKPGALLKVLGPCALYVIDVGLPDSDFDVDYGGSCTGPSRWGLIYRPPGSVDTDFVNIEIETTTPLLFSSDTFSHACTSGLITVSVELEFTSLNREGVELRFIESAVTVATYQNTIAGFNSQVGGHLQFLSGDCACGTFGPEICISPPDR